MDATTAGLIGAVISGAVTYLMALRRLSGKIETSEAKDLWKESTAIREFTAKRLEQLTAYVGRLETRVEALETSNQDLIKENSHLHTEVTRLSQRNEKLSDECHRLEQELTKARERISELEARNG